jgi:hypothetical protein
MVEQLGSRLQGARLTAGLAPDWLPVSPGLTPSIVNYYLRPLGLAEAD